MLKQLIVNADDYGMAVGVNAGIIEGYQRGIVTSTTMMATGNALKDGLYRLRDVPGLDTGCHLVLLGGEPAAKPGQVRSLLDGSGRFPRTLGAFLMRMAGGQVKQQEILIEFRAQLDRLYDFGIKLSHFDSHKHSHAHPAVLDAVIRLAEEYKIRYIRNPFERYPMRKIGQSQKHGRLKLLKRYLLSRMLDYYRLVFQLRMRETGVLCPDHFHGFVMTGHLTPEAMQEVLNQVSEGVNELMCHPGRLEPDLINTTTRLKESRERELAALTSLQARQAISTQGIQLTSFQKLVEESQKLKVESQGLR
jgi:chitin disaccharide deacetylase